MRYPIRMHVSGCKNNLNPILHVPCSQALRSAILSINVVKMLTQRNIGGRPGGLSPCIFFRRTTSIDPVWIKVYVTDWHRETSLRGQFFWIEILFHGHLITLQEYEEVIIPPAKPIPPKADERLIPVSELEELVKGCFTVILGSPHRPFTNLRKD